MPYVKPLEAGLNTGLVKGLSERTRSLEAQRAALNLTYESAVPLVFPGSQPLNVWTACPQGWPTSTVLVGEQGAVWTITQYQFQPPIVGNASIVVLPGVDGASPVFGAALGDWDLDTLIATNSDQAFTALLGISGITPGWHTLSLWYNIFIADASGRTTTYGNPSLIAWTL